MLGQTAAVELVEETSLIGGVQQAGWVHAVEGRTDLRQTVIQAAHGSRLVTAQHKRSIARVMRCDRGTGMGHGKLKTQTYRTVGLR